MGKSDDNVSPAKTRKGRAVLIGFGLDDAEGHVRFTHADSYNLFGGSQTTHDEMRRRATRIVDELRRKGYSLDNLTRDQLDEVRTIVERASAE